MLKKNKTNIINPFSYWVIKGKVAAGEYPGTQFSFNIMTTVATLVHSVRALFLSKGCFINSSSIKIGDLLDNGIRTFVDLTEDGERPYYRSILHKEKRKRSLDCRYFRFPIKDRQVPTVNQMMDIIALVKSEVERGRPVYLHCFRGLGRTGLAVGCLIQEYVVFSTDPLKDILKMRKGLAGDFRGSPETKNQIEFVRDWLKTGLPTKRSEFDVDSIW